MRIASSYVSAFSVLSLLIAGCAESSATAPPALKATQFLLASEPAGALDVLDIKEQLQDGERVVVMGRVGGGIKPWIDGRAAFLLTDSRIEASCEDGDKCELGCPGCSKEMMEASTMVKFLADDGKVLPVDARELLGLKERQTVVVEGVASRDSTGNLSIAGRNIYIRK